jgi:hypothetical protein
MMKGTGMKSGITVTIEASRMPVAFASLYIERISSDSCAYEEKMLLFYGLWRRLLTNVRTKLSKEYSSSIYMTKSERP